MRQAVLTALTLVLLSFGASSASAEWEPEGALRGYLQVETGAPESRVGGGGIVDLWKSYGAFRIGFALGLGAVTSDNDDATSVYAPAAMSLGVGHDFGVVGLSLTARVGAYASATNSGLGGGGYLSGGAGIDFGIGERLGIEIGAEYWVLYGSETRRFVVPEIALRWSV